MPRTTPRNRGNSSSLAHLRLAAGLTQQQLADQIGVTQITLSRWESGAQTPSGRNLVKLADALNCHIEDLLVEL